MVAPSIKSNPAKFIVIAASGAAGSVYPYIGSVKV